MIDEKVVEVATGSEHALVRTEKGRVFGFGSNIYGVRLVFLHSFKIYYLATRHWRSRRDSQDSSDPRRSTNYLVENSEIGQASKRFMH